MASDRSLPEILSQRTLPEIDAEIKDLEAAVGDTPADAETYFALGQAYFSRAAALLEKGGDRLSASLDLAQAMGSTEKSIKLGCSSPDASVRVVAISAAQIMVYYSVRGHVPEAGGLFEKLMHHFSYSANIALEKIKESSGKNQSLVQSLALAVEPLISDRLYQNLPHPFNERFAALCKRLGAGAGMMGVTGESADFLLSV